MIQAGAAGPAEILALHRQRFALMNRMVPLVYRGATRFPTTAATRGSPGALTKIESGKRRLYYVNHNWPRVSSVKERTSGTARTGYLRETLRTNKFIWTDISNAAWTKVNATVSSALGYNGPEQLSDMRAIVGAVAGGANVQHGVTLNPALTAANYWITCFVSLGNKTWAYLVDETDGNAFIYVNLATGVIGTTIGGNVLWHMIEGPYFGPVGDSYRIGFMLLGTAAAHTVGIYAADDDNDPLFVGDGATINLYASLPQVEAGNTPSSPIKTIGAAASRAIDVPPIYKGDDGNLGRVGSNKEGAIEVEVVVPLNWPGVSGIVSLSDGGAAADSVRLDLTAAGLPQANTAAAAGAPGQVTCAQWINDGELHRLRIVYRQNNLALHRDGNAEAAGDGACDMPDDLDQIKLDTPAGGAPCGGIIRRVRFFPHARR